MTQRYEKHISERQAMLKVTNLTSVYGNIEAIRDISLNVGKGKAVALLGSNGAGKSTTLNTIAGLHQPLNGSVVFNDENITKYPLYKRVRLGLAIAPEGHRIVTPLSVHENLELSAYSARGDVDELRDWVYTLFPRLKDRLNQNAGMLSGGEQQMLSVARALMTNPDLLLLDEPSMGLAPAVIDIVFEAIHSINQKGVSILLVEQNAAIALPLCDYAYVLKQGELVLEGEPETISSTTEIMDSYLG